MLDFLFTNNLIPVVFSLLGCFVVHWLSAGRDKKNRLFNEATVLYTELTNIHTLATSSHSSMENPRGITEKEVKTLAVRCEQFKKRFLAFLHSYENSSQKYRERQDLVIAFRRALTGDAYKTYPSFIMALNLAYTNLEKEISSIRKKLY